MDINIIEMAEIFDVLSNSVRLCILTNLYFHTEKNVGGLQTCAGASQSVVSQQLAKLKALGIISSKKIGNEVYYHISNEVVKKILKIMFENGLNIQK